MFRRIFNRILYPRHPWRSVKFTELSEMYIAGFLKMFAVGLIGVFIPLYIMRNGYSLTDVFMYYTLLYAFCVIGDLASGYLTARFGPKHVMRLGFFFQFVTAILLSQIKYLPNALFIIAIFHSLSAVFYWLPYHVDISKIKHAMHSGKELSWLRTMEKVGGVVGPIVGGLLATMYGGAALFYLAAFILMIAVGVLMMSPEAMHTRQKFDFKQIGQLQDWRTKVAHMSMNLENSISAILWPTFLAAVVFTTNSYLNIGAVTSISVIVSILVAVPLGHLLDGHSGKSMLRIGAVINSIVHISRTFVNSFAGVIGISIVNEPNTLVYNLPYFKGFYDSADDYHGKRIVFMTQFEMLTHGVDPVFWLLMTVLSTQIPTKSVFIVGFMIAAVASLLIQLQHYKALK